jgi:apolipoprotein N-acyltransferase
MSSSFYTMQIASVGGVFGLSFLVILTNAFFLRAWIQPFYSNWLIAGVIFLLPYGFGWMHIEWHAKKFNDSSSIQAILVQPFLPIEENMAFQTAIEARQFVLNEWKQILQTLPQYTKKNVDLIVLPEYVVPYGTFHPVFPVLLIQNMFKETFGEWVTPYLEEESPYIEWISTDKGWQQLVSNAYISQLLANIFNAHLVVGLEDNVYMDEEKSRVEAYSAAFHFRPNGDVPERYEKRILVPMGEYIPFEWCRSLAKKYGIQGSFTSGKSARVFAGPVPMGASICYEEMYGHLMRENRIQGAELLVNLTNDGWYPGSRLCQQHFDHARLRTVENGIALVRSCNTGITGVIDSMGRTIEVLKNQQADSLYVKIPLFHYLTFYTQWGDFTILGVAGGCILQSVFRKYFIKKKKQP